jgi:beta-phosphoglucomutase
MPKPAVIFDMDGVLADTYQPHFESWRRLYGELGIEYSESDFAKDFGRTSRDILRRTLGADLTEDRMHELDSRKESYFREILRDSSAAMDGAIDLIDGLVADGFLLAVGSSGPPENVSLILDMLGRREQFSAVVTGSDVTRGKPDPQVFQLAAERLQVPPKLCVVVEDAVHGVEAAGRAGMKSVGLLGTATRDDLAKADLVIESLREITPATLRDLIDGRTRGSSG